MIRLKTMQRGLIAVLLASTALTTAACDEKKKEGSKEDVGNKCLADLMDARRTRSKGFLPASDDAGDDEHPWLGWVKKAASVGQGSDFKACAIKGEGSPAEETADTLARMFEMQRNYFASEKAAPREYLAELEGGRRVSKGKPWEADVEFDYLFFHASRLANSWTLLQASPRDDRVTLFFTYELVLWEAKAETSFYEDEISKLCKEKVPGYCAKIPMEDQPFALTKPYFEQVGKKFLEFKTKYPQSPYAGFAERIAKVYEARAAKMPEYPEYPILPPIRSTKPAPYSGNATLMVTAAKGLSLMDNLLRSPTPLPVKEGEKPKPPWKGDYAADPALVKEVQQLVQDVRASTVSQFNQSMIYVVAEDKVPVGYLEPLLRTSIEGENSKNWPTFMLVGRRRADGTNRRSGFVATLNKSNEVVKFKFKSPAGKPLACEAWAAIGKEQLTGLGFKPIIWHDGTQVHTGRLDESGAMTGVQSAPGHGEGDRLESWVDQQSTSVVVALPHTATYAQWLEALNGVAFKCEKDECTTERSVKIFLATCK
jgi:hypothetical protein